MHFFLGEIRGNDWKHQNHRENPWNVLDSWLSASRCYPMLSHDLQVYYHQSWKRRVAGEGAYWVLAGSQDHASMSFWASQLKDSEWLEWHLENPRTMIHDDSWWSMTNDWSRAFHMNCHIHACKICFGVSRRRSFFPWRKVMPVGIGDKIMKATSIGATKSSRFDSLSWTLLSLTSKLIMSAALEPMAGGHSWKKFLRQDKSLNNNAVGFVGLLNGRACCFCAIVTETGFKQIENNKDFSTSKETYGHPMDNGFPRDPFWMDYHQLPTLRL